MRSPSSRSCSQIGRVPLGGPALEQLAAPDVVDEHVDVAVVVADLLGEVPHLIGIEVVDGARRCRCRPASVTSSAVSSIVSARS